MFLKLENNSLCVMYIKNNNIGCKILYYVQKIKR